VLHFTNGLWSAVSENRESRKGDTEGGKANSPTGAYQPARYAYVDVAAMGPNSMVTVGYYVPENSFKEYPILSCYGGSCGYPINVGSGMWLDGVAATGPNDIWAVGGDGNGAALTEHWNGSQWSVVAS